MPARNGLTSRAMSGVGASVEECDAWLPIDEVLSTARLVMRSGQMIHPPGFQLYHSMNALQILDPKMDVGMAPPNGEPHMKSLVVLINENRAPVELTDDDQIYVFDALLACEATWHCGQALATTVYTCLYMHDLDRLEKTGRGPVMRAYFHATQSSVATVRHAVSTGDVWEEEDFVLHVAGFDVGEAAIGEDGDADADEGNKNKDKQAKNKNENVNPALAGLLAAEAWLLDNAGVEDRHGGLLARIRFRIALHETFVALFRMANPAMALERASDAKKALAEAKRNLAKMKKTKSTRGARVPPSESATTETQTGTKNTTDTKTTETAKTQLDWDPNGLGFDRKINLSLMGPSPPRVVSLFAIDASFVYFEKLLDELTRVCDVAPMLASGRGTLHELLAFLSWTSDFAPSIVSRSFLANAVLRPKQRNGGNGILGKPGADAALRSAWLFTGEPVFVIELPRESDVDVDLGGTGDGGGDDFDGDDESSVDRVFIGGQTCGPAGGALAHADRGGVQKTTPDLSLKTPLDSKPVDGNEEVSFFLSKTSLAVELLVRAYLSNVSRSRRKLRRLVGEWSLVVDHANIADVAGFAPNYLNAVQHEAIKRIDAKNKNKEVLTAGALAKTPWARRVFQTWASGVLVRAMLAHLTLGFTLELYLPHELCMVYWYQEYLMEDLQRKLRVAEVSLETHAEAASNYTDEKSATGGSNSKSAKKKGGKKGNSDKKDKKDDDDSDDSVLSPLHVHLLNLKMEGHVLEVHKTMCKGMIRFTGGLDFGKRTWRPSRDDHTDSEQNFWQRFGVFHAVKDPHPLSHDDFAKYITLGDGVTVDRLFALAGECFASVRTLCARLLELPPEALSQAQREDLVGVDKTAAANAAAAKLAAAAPTMRAEFAHKAYHPTFPTVKMKREG